MLGEAPPVAIVERHCDALAFAEGRGDRIGQTTAILQGWRDSIDQHENVRARPHPSFRALLIETHDIAVDLGAHESGRTQLRGNLDIRTLGGLGQGECDDHVSPIPFAVPRFSRPVCRQYVINRFLHRIAFHFVTALQTALRSGAGPQQAQEISNFGGCTDGGSA